MNRVLLLTVVIASVLTGGRSYAAEGEQPRFVGGKRNAIPGRYLVMLRAGAVAKGSAANDPGALAREHGGEARAVWQHAITGFEFVGTESAAIALSNNPAVEWVEQDGAVTATQFAQASAPWALDRVDQQNLPLDSMYHYPVTASGVNVYVIDSGIVANHVEFGGRASGAFSSPVFMGTTDCYGHGTHVAGIIGASTYGVAKKALLRAVRVLDCNGSGTVGQMVSGIDWVTGNAIRPAVANISMFADPSVTLDAAVQNSIDSGITYVVAAANQGAESCEWSPARVGSAITVGASTAGDAVASFSNTGSCVDVFAPGSSVLSTYIGSTTATQTLSGTSMAAPHVTGTVAMYLAWNPNATPAQVANAIRGSATAGVLTGVPAGTDNRLLFSPFMPTCGGTLDVCRGVCVDFMSNFSNCGACGRVCAGSGLKCFFPGGGWYWAGQHCSAGKCVSNQCEF